MKLTNKHLKDMIKETLKEYFEPSGVPEIEGSIIDNTDNPGVYTVRLQLGGEYAQAGPKGQNPFAPDRSIYNPSRVQFNIPNLPLRNDLDHSATMVSQYASREGFNIDPQAILSAIESGKIELPYDMR